MHAKTFSKSWKWMTNSWKRSSQEISHGFFNMILRQSNKVISGKVRFHQDPKKHRMQRSQAKVMLITFFDHHRLVNHKFVPQGQTVNQQFYKEVLTCLVNKISQKQRDSWAGKTRILHHDNAPAYTALSVKHFLVSKEISLLDHPLYLLHLAPCIFFLFPNLVFSFFFQNSRGHASKELMLSRPMLRPTSKASKKKNLHNASRHGQEE